MKAILAIAFGCVLAVQAQVMLPHRRSAAIPLSPYPLPNSGLAWWWVSEDVSTNSVVTNWVDRIRGDVLSNTYGTSCPTNTSLTGGIYFNGASNQFLTTSITVGPLLNTNVTLIVVCNITGGDAWQTVWSKDNSGAWAMGMDAGSWDVYIAGVKYLIDSNPSGWFDASVSTYRVPADTAIGYINAVAYATNNAYLLDNPMSFGRMGSVPGQSLTGYIRELLIYTNSLTAPTISQFHQYATNKYGYSP